jgi:signal transduction histidine kinase
MPLQVLKLAKIRKRAKKKTIDALYQNEEKLRLILENISEGIIANADKKIILANYIANEMLNSRGR